MMTMQEYTLDFNYLQARCSELKIDFSASALAKISKIHRNSLSHFINGKLSPYSKVILKLAVALKIEPEKLIKKKLENNFDEAVSALINNTKELFEENQNIAFLLIGSRAKRKFKPLSDIDLGITGGINKLNTEQFLLLYNRVKELNDDLKWKVDVVNLDIAPNWFFKEMNYSPKFISGNKEAFSYISGVRDAIQKMD